MKNNLSTRIRVLAVFLLSVYFVLKTGHETALIRATPETSWNQDQSADCAVVLTGGPGRVREGVDLLAHKLIRKLIISGVHPQADWREIFQAWPFYQDVAESDIILERRSQTTYGNAQQTASLAEALNCKDLLIVTSATHMRRALKTFQAELVGRIPVKGRALALSQSEASAFEIGLEAAKSVFYSFWAY